MQQTSTLQTSAPGAGMVHDALDNGGSAEMTRWQLLAEIQVALDAAYSQSISPGRAWYIQDERGHSLAGIRVASPRDDAGWAVVIRSSSAGMIREIAITRRDQIAGLTMQIDALVDAMSRARHARCVNAVNYNANSF